MVNMFVQIVFQNAIFGVDMSCNIQIMCLFEIVMNWAYLLSIVFVVMWKQVQLFAFILKTLHFG
jgi:hypothetical protein